MACQGMGLKGKTWDGKERHDISRNVIARAWKGMKWHVMARKGMEWNDKERDGMAW